ncbi:MAG: elongation factor P [Candidatus Marinimicrobia bacterium]|nr:elongation factor P [Candidatus Neomarinimicrobiota bacterium]
MASTSDFRVGMVIIYNDELYKIVEYQHAKVGRGGALVKTKLKSIADGKVINNTFRGGEKVKEARVEAREMEYLYSDGLNYYFMDKETFEQMPINESIIGDSMNYISENQTVKVLVYDEKPVGMELPTAVNLKIKKAAPGVRGDTATSVTKPATLETGLVVDVPIFIEEGELIKVDTRDGKYLSRAK